MPGEPEVGLFSTLARILKQPAFAGALLLPAGFASSGANAQSHVSQTGQVSQLPDAPVAAQAANQTQIPDSQLATQGNISGTITDTNGDVVQGAQVNLNGPTAATVARTVSSGSDGQFQFANVPPGAYTLTVTANGMTTYKSGTIQLSAGQFRIAPTIVLAVSGGATSVTVTADREQLSQQQVQIAVQQRVAGVIPNFYSTFDWNAPPMMAKQKFHLIFRSIIDPVSFLAVAAVAGAEQYQGVFPAYGTGLEGYGKRYGAALANRVTGELLGRGVYPSIFHQDPRYFYKGKGSIRSRALYAISRAVVTRSDDGRLEPNYSEVLGDLSAGAISNLYYPQSDRGASLLLINGLSGVGANAAANLIREFVLKGITTHVPKGANGQPPSNP